MKLIIGLGNHGKQYLQTRHNVGFMAIDNFAKKHNLLWKDGYLGQYIKTTIFDKTVVFYKPHTFMNLSGMGCFQIMNYFNIDIKDIFVIYDDINFDIGKYKIKCNGSAGGHNGMKNIIEVLKSDQINRLKIGIGKPTIGLTNYVLQNFKLEELKVLDNLFNNTNSIIEDFIKNITLNKILTKYNGN